MKKILFISTILLSGCNKTQTNPKISTQLNYKDVVDEGDFYHNLVFEFLSIKEANIEIKYITQNYNCIVTHFQSSAGSGYYKPHYSFVLLCKKTNI